MTRFFILWCSVLLGLGFSSAAVAETEEEAASLAAALKGGDAKVDLRLRYEEVREEARSKDAHAGTLRTTLSYATRPYRGWSLFLEGENVTAIGNELYNNRGAGSLANGVTDRPVVADPEITEVNQAYVAYSHGSTTVKVGRQEILFGDQRFVGAVGWRQNHQSLDAVRLDHKIKDRYVLRYAFVENVNRIFGDNKPMASCLIDADIPLVEGLGLRAYGYWLDYDRVADAGLSRVTYGAELSGKAKAGDATLLYELEAATQRDYGDNPNDISAGYLHAMLGGAFGGITVKVGGEILEGEPGDGAFVTPLATLHKFNGWADKFLATPATGLEDLYLSLSGKLGQVPWTLTYHDFSSESTSSDYGSEIDLLLTYKADWGQSFGLKGAFYQADDFSTDTEKVIVWTGYSF